MARDTRQLKKQYLIASVLDPIFQLTIMMLALAGLVLYPTIESKQVVPRLIQSMPIAGLQWFAIAGLLAVVMSTADSYLHTAGVTITHDIIRPLRGFSIRELDELRYSRYSTLAVGLVSMLIALCFENMLSLVFSALQFTGPVLIFSLLAGILGVRAHKRTFFIALWVTVAAFLVARWVLPADKKHLAVLVSIVANGISFLGAHVKSQRTHLNQ